LGQAVGSLSFQDIIGGLMGAVTGATALFIAILPSYFQTPYVYGNIFYGPVKSPELVLPGLIRNPEFI